MPIVDWSDRIIIAELSDEPAFSDDMDALLRRVEDGEEEPPDVIVNMQGVSYMNSSNISQLLRLRKRLLIANRRMRLCSVADTVWSEIMVTGLDKIMEFTDDVSTSLASLQIEE
jgi:anti-anti-sigma factor